VKAIAPTMTFSCFAAAEGHLIFFDVRVIQRGGFARVAEDKVIGASFTDGALQDAIVVRFDGHAPVLIHAISNFFLILSMCA
jgi:hypothetical protein